MFCKKCGKELENGAVFCQFCGQKQTENVEENVQKKEEQMSNKKLILAGTVMAAAILAVIAVFKLFIEDKGNDVADNMTVKETTEIENVAEEKSEKEVIDTVDSEDGQAAVEEMETAEAEEAEEMQVSHMAIGENEYWFDEDGDLIKIVEEGGDTLDIQYLTDAVGNKVKGNMSEKFIDMVSVPEISSEGLVPCCNTKGYLFESLIWSGEQQEQHTYMYDSGNIIEAQVTYQGDSGERKMDASFQYDEGNNQIVISVHVVSTLYGDNDEYQFVYTCSFKGDKLVKLVCDSDSPGVAINYREREYDNSGNLTREKSGFTTSTNHTDETIYQYDGNGNLLECNRVHQSEYEGVEKASEVYIDVYQYDEIGNMVKMEGGLHNTQEGRQSSDNNYIVNYQYDANGNKVQQKRSDESLQYDEAGTVVKQSSFVRNYIWEYDTEGKLILYSFVASSTGNDVIEVKSEYLYDEQGQLSEILVGGETAMSISYTEAGTLQQIDFVKEIENANGIEWSLIENLIPEEVKAEVELLLWLPSISNKKVIIEYR